MVEPAFTMFTRSDATIALQPIIPTSGEASEGVFMEALLRLPQSSDPACHVHVLTLADQLGFAHQIDLFVLSKVVDLLQRKPHIKISLNVSQRSILEDGQKIIRRLAASQMCDRIVVEVTETLQIPQAWVAAFAAGVREIGCLVAVDDYDTGSANDDLVQTVRPHILKFAMEDTSAASMDRLTRTVAMAEAIGAKVVMEKVDSVEKYGLAVAHGIAYMQGYLLSKPFLAQHLSSWLVRSKHAEVPVDYARATRIPDFASTQLIETADGDGGVCLKQKTGS